MVELIKDRDQLDEQSTLPTGMSWMVQALSALPVKKQSSEPKRFATHGVIKPGSTTDKVFRFLQAPYPLVSVKPNCCRHRLQR